MIPVPTPDQAATVLKILGEWTKRGWWYETYDIIWPSGRKSVVHYSDPDPSSEDNLKSEGVNHFDAIAQATTVMQMLLEEYPEKS